MLLKSHELCFPLLETSLAWHCSELWWSRCRRQKVLQGKKRPKLTLTSSAVSHAGESREESVVRSLWCLATRRIQLYNKKKTAGCLGSFLMEPSDGFGVRRRTSRALVDKPARVWTYRLPQDTSGKSSMNRNTSQLLGYSVPRRCRGITSRRG